MYDIQSGKEKQKQNNNRTNTDTNSILSGKKIKIQLEN